MTIHKKNLQKSKKRIIFYSILLGFVFGTFILSKVNGYIIKFELFDQVLTSTIATLIILILKELVKRLVHVPVLKKALNTTLLVVLATTIFFIFQNNLLALGVSLGVLAGVSTIIFQSALLNLVGWGYLTAYNLFIEGQRIRIGDVKGDVVAIMAMHTKISEVGGEYVSGDLPSGRIITIPNAQFLSTPLINYSKFLDFIWSDIIFQLTYISDFQFLIEKTTTIVEEYLSKKIKKYREQYEDFIDIHDIENDRFKAAHYNISPLQSWIEFKITIPLPAKLRTKILSDLTKEILELFKKHPEKVAFPRGRNR